MNLNKVFIIGRLTADPQLRTTTGGQSVASFGVATNRVWTNKAGAKQESTEFHNIVVWGRQAEIVSQFLTKGATVMIEGRLQTRSWTDKQGQPRKTTDIVAERVQFGPRPFGQQQATPSSFATGQVGGQGEEQAHAEEIPTINLEESEVINLEESEVKPEDLPF